MSAAAPSDPGTPPHDDARAAVARAVAEACERFAPTWPLDQLIAVNPLWSFTDQAFFDAVATIGARSGARLLPGAAHAREAWRRGELDLDDLRAVCARRGGATPESLRASMELDDPIPPRRMRFAEVLDARRELSRELAWSDFVVNDTSQFCAAFFDEGQASLVPDHRGGLFASWRRRALRDQTPRLLMGFDHYGSLARALPETADEMAVTALRALDVPAHEAAAYLHALLLNQLGWSSWCAYQRWRARREGRDDRALEDLLGIRLAWEWLLLRAAPAPAVERWRQAMRAWPDADRAVRDAQSHARLLLEAAEVGLQRRVLPRLAEGRDARRPERVSAQVVCCIDVRSEPLRRALEALADDVQTLGFAGFFGLPAEYRAAGAQRAWPHLPGLLAPRFLILDDEDGTRDGHRAKALDAMHAAHELKRRPAATFAFIEALGISHALRLLAGQLGLADLDPARAGVRASAGRSPRPRVAAACDGSPLTPDARVALAEAVLRGMSLTRGFAPLVLLLGHGASTRNNPHAAGLHCGACGGQTGEVSARAVAGLLNDAAVREGLRAKGVEIPAATRFVAGLHDTTTDDLSLFDHHDLDGPAAAALQALAPRLEAASQRVREERAPALGLGEVPPSQLPAAMRRRARDWAQLRPEWGLANNALFLAMPRERCRHLKLDGRAFLHEYRADEDPDAAVLEGILTAPVMVAHWINLQYYASTVDNARYGCGNKTLHNVVGGRVGVFEGNGGDLRIGLALQSLHDGARWMHQPLRLTVVVEADGEAVRAIIARQPRLHDLLRHGWMHLFALDPRGATLRRYERGDWHDGELSARPTSG